MAFFGKLGNILRQTSNRNMISELRSSPSAFQAIRCMCSAPNTKLFIGGVSYSTDEQGLREAFSRYGEVLDARIIVDRETGRSRGFGFITFNSVEEASSAIQALDGQDLHGRRVRVNFANERPRGYGGGSGGGGGYAGSQYVGASSGGGYGGNVDGGYGGGGYGGGSYGPGGNYGGTGAANTYSAPNSFETNNTGGGLEYGSGGQFDIQESSNVKEDSADVGDPISNVNEDSADVGDPIEGNYRDDDDDTGGELEYGSSGQFDIQESSNVKEDSADVGDPISNVNEDSADVGDPIEGNSRNDDNDTGGELEYGSSGQFDIQESSNVKEDSHMIFSISFPLSP